MGEMKVVGGNLSEGIITTKLDALLGWARKYSLFQYPFATACCGMEFFAVASPRYDIARFGAEAPRFSPRQSDVLWVVGTISQRQGPVLKRIYEQMTEPKWVVAFGTCASCGGFYDNYTTIPGVDKIVPVDVYIPGCPPRPEGPRNSASIGSSSGLRFHTSVFTSPMGLICSTPSGCVMPLNAMSHVIRRPSIRR